MKVVRAKWRTFIRQDKRGEYRHFTRVNLYYLRDNSITKRLTIIVRSRSNQGRLINFDEKKTYPEYINTEGVALQEYFCIQQLYSSSSDYRKSRINRKGNRENCITVVLTSLPVAYPNLQTSETLIKDTYFILHKHSPDCVWEI